MTADIGGSFEHGAGAVSELDSVEREVDIWAVTGGIIPNFKYGTIWS